MKFGKWTVDIDPSEMRVMRKFYATCDCGRTGIVLGLTLKKGRGCAACRMKVVRRSLYLAEGFNARAKRLQDEKSDEE